MKLRITNSPLTMILAILALGVVMNAPAFAASGTWSAAASVLTPRDGHTPTFCPNGNVVIAGGEDNNLALDSSEVYSPTMGSWTVSGNLNVARSNASAGLLPSGSILIAEGCVSNCLGPTKASAELYSSMNGKWSSTGVMSKARTYFSVVLLANGEVHVAGGCTGLNANGCRGVTNKAEIYNPSTGKWTPTGSMTAARGKSHSHTPAQRRSSGGGRHQWCWQSDRHC